MRTEASTLRFFSVKQLKVQLTLKALCELSGPFQSAKCGWTFNRKGLYELISRICK